MIMLAVQVTTLMVIIIVVAVEIIIKGEDSEIGAAAATTALEKAEEAQRARVWAEEQVRYMVRNQNLFQRNGCKTTLSTKRRTFLPSRKCSISSTEVMHVDTLKCCNSVEGIIPSLTVAGVMASKR